MSSSSTCSLSLVLKVKHNFVHYHPARLKMDSTKPNTGSPQQLQPLVDLTNKLSIDEGSQPPEKENVAHVVVVEIQHGHAITGRNALEVAETEAPTKIIFPDFDQVPLSTSVDATGKYQLANEYFNSSTAEIAANSPRYRRRSSTFIDGVHDLPDEKASPMAPAQLYSTMSGRLFHSGRIAIVLVGPPARGKT